MSVDVDALVRIVVAVHRALGRDLDARAIAADVLALAGDAPSSPGTPRAPAASLAPHVVTERDVRDAAAHGRALDLRRGTVVTPLARDAARELAVNLIEAG